MKRFKIIALFTLAFLLFNQVVVVAQNYPYKKSQKENYKNQKEEKKYQDKKQKERLKYLEKQDKNRKKHHENINKSYGKKYSNHAYTNKGKLPNWAKAHRYTAKKHVYFRDYDLFYDARRQGYVYTHKNKWAFSKNIPSHLRKVDLNRARIQVLNDIPYTSRPEEHYGRYTKRYPRNPRIQFGINLF